MRRRRVLTVLAAATAVALAAGLYWFQPWKLWVDHRVDETLPTVAARTSTAAPAAASPSRTPSMTSTAPSAPQDVLLAQGRLISHEHRTRGTVSLVRRADGHRVLTLADLDTSDGPAVEVWLTDAPVLTGKRGWYVFDDGRHRSLGGLKGNLGNQVYRVPDDLDLADYTSVSLWCARFDVSFGAAELEPVS